MTPEMVETLSRRMNDAVKAVRGVMVSSKATGFIRRRVRAMTMHSVAILPIRRKD
jgi:hypothetical protein